MHGKTIEAILLVRALIERTREHLDGTADRLGFVSDEARRSADSNDRKVWDQLHRAASLVLAEGRDLSRFDELAQDRVTVDEYSSAGRWVRDQSMNLAFAMLDELMSLFPEVDWVVAIAGD